MQGDLFADELRLSPIEIERRRRIRVSLFAYAYEVKDNPLVSDSYFDKLCLEIKPAVGTGKLKLDKFFKNVFEPHTGQWIHKHPELNKVAALYEERKNGKFKES
jgi:hypothetical protein